VLVSWCSQGVYMVSRGAGWGRGMTGQLSAALGRWGGGGGRQLLLLTADC
jgi:hypothetical protein